MHPSAPTSLLVPFVALVLAVLLLVGRGLFALSTAPGFRLRVTLGLAAYLVIPAALALSGVIQRFDSFPPPFMPMVAVLLGTCVWAACSPLGSAVLARYSLATLVGLQAFRLPLELIMHHAAKVGVMPSVMSYDPGNAGRNFDIVTGILALLLFPLLRSGKLGSGVVWLWLVLAFGLLFNVVTVAVLATPLFLRFGPEQANTWVAYVPFVWLPSVLVTTALAGQLLVLRKLLSQR